MLTPLLPPYLHPRNSVRFRGVPACLRGYLVSFRHQASILEIASSPSCVRQVQQIDHVERVLVGFQVNSSIPLFDRK
jgi:hypothetical protein